MKLDSYASAGEFLQTVQTALELNEAANSLMLGLALRLSRDPGWEPNGALLKTVTDDHGLALAALMTPPHNLILYARGDNLDPATRLLAEDLVQAGWKVPGVLAAKGTAGAFSAQWTHLTSAQARLRSTLSVLELRELQAPAPVDGRLRLAMADDLDLVARWGYGFAVDIFGEGDMAEERQMVESRIRNGDIYLWEDGVPVSMAMKNRPTRNGITVSYVYTPSESRNKGHASACVAGLSRLLLDSGWQFCTLFVDHANPSADHIYRKMGYGWVCDYAEYIFKS